MNAKYLPLYAITTGLGMYGLVEHLTESHLWGGVAGMFIFAILFFIAIAANDIIDAIKDLRRVK